MGAWAAGVAELRESQAELLDSLLRDAFVLNKYKRCWCSGAPSVGAGVLAGAGAGSKPATS